jgi:hypothetical protein
MGRVFLFMILSASALACAPANTSGEAEKAASDNASLDEVQKKRDQLVQRLEKAPREDREQCEFSAGDCLVLVGERRERLASQHGLICGQQVEPARRSACIADGLRAAGKAAVAKEYYGFEAWCMQRVLACTADRAEKAALAVRDHKRAERKREIVSSDRGADAWNAVEVAHARVQYLESTLPPNVEVSCTEQAEGCAARVAKADEAFQAELAREDFDLERATKSYVEARSVEENCETPVFECLKQALAPHGMFPPSESLLQKNFSLLKKRQELTRGVSPEAQADCLSTPTADHQEQIVAAFTAYAKEPVLYFRMQLEKAFSAMHQAQVTCLAAQPKVLPETPERSAQSTP